MEEYWAEVQTSYGCVDRGRVDVVLRSGGRIDIDSFAPVQSFVILRYITHRLKGKKERWDYVTLVGQMAERQKIYTERGERVRGGGGCSIE